MMMTMTIMTMMTMMTMMMMMMTMMMMMMMIMMMMITHFVLQILMNALQIRAKITASATIGLKDMIACAREDFLGITVKKVK